MMPLPCVALLAIPLTVGSPFAQEATRAAADPFPPPRAALTIAASGADGGPTLLDLLRDFSAVTGHNLSIDDATRSSAAQRGVGLLQSVEVPPAQVYSFVESLLLERGFVLTVQRAQAPRLLGVHERQPGQDLPAWNVPAGELERYRDHPAVMISTVLHLWPVDVRQLGNSLRALSNDGTSIVPIGNTSSIILRGAGRRVAEMAWILESTAEAEREFAARQASRAAQDGERRGGAQGDEGKPEGREKPRNPR